MALLAGALIVPAVGTLWAIWHSDARFSHGPLIALIAGGLLWMRRREMGTWQAASLAGMALFVLSALGHVAANWAAADFLKPLSLIAMAAGAVAFLGGKEALWASAGALGFLVFMSPWPQTVTTRLAFPLQLTSSAYAALLGGICGLPVHQEGVHLCVLGGPGQKPVYDILVGQQCSGLNSLMVLLALGYLIAYHTPVALLWRAALMLAVVPMTLLLNAVRLTLILVVGAHFSAALAQWVHDHETPVLISLCSLALWALRQGLVAWVPGAGEQRERMGEWANGRVGARRCRRRSPIPPFPHPPTLPETAASSGSTASWR
jgi:exosortase